MSVTLMEVVGIVAVISAVISAGNVRDRFIPFMLSVIVAGLSAFALIYRYMGGT